MQGADALSTPHFAVPQLRATEGLPVPGRAVPVEPAPGPSIAFLGAQPLVSDALSYLLSATTDFSVVGAFVDVAGLMEATDGAGAELAMVDVDAPGDVGWAALAELQVAGVSKVVLLAETLTRNVIAAAVEHRVDGVLLKSESLVDLLAALRHIVSGHTVFPAGWHEVAAREPADRALLASLSPRQREVLELLAAGRRNEEIAADLYLSLNTVKFHVRAILARLGVRNRVEAAQVLARLERDR